MKKKKYFASIVLLLIIGFSNIYCQSLADLDARNGYKDLKLGDSFNKWSSDLTELFRDDAVKGERYFKYNGMCCTKVFEFPVERIILTFYDNKIVRIYIELQNFQTFYKRQYTTGFSKDGGYNILNSEFASLFGKPSDSKFEKDGNPYHIFTGWFGQKVHLESCYKYIGAAEGEFAVIVIVSAEYKMKDLKNGF